MSFRKLRPAYLAAAIVASAGILAGGVALRPALAGGHADVEPFGVVNCNSTSPCQTYHNKGTGPGVVGTTANGFGMRATATGTGTGIIVSAVGGYGVISTTNDGNGVYGGSVYSYGLSGKSGDSIGVYGASDASNGMYASGGISGSSLYAISNYSNYAVEAHSGGTGVASFADNGAALSGQSTSSYGVSATTGGLLAAYVYNNGAGSGTGKGLDATGRYLGVIRRAQSGVAGFPILPTDLAGNDLFFINGNGDVYYHGTLHGLTRTRDGRTASAFSSKTTSPTVEDNGSGQLVNSVATIFLDPTFPQTIDARTAYHVMLAPDGDTRGLFVASKSPGSFVVREVQGGHGSLSFDYHIYAPALGFAGARMTVTDRASMPGPQARPVVFRAPKATRPTLHHT